MQLVHPVFTFGLLVLTRFALTWEEADVAVEALASDEVEAEGALVEEAEEAGADAETDGLLEAARVSAAALGVAGVLVDAGETLLLL